MLRAVKRQTGFFSRHLLSRFLERSELGKHDVLRVPALLLVATSLVLLSCRSGEPTNTKAVNVVLVSIDTLRADHLGCYGYDRNTSPEIDKLAAQSILFEEARSQANWTLPSHMSLLESRLPSDVRWNLPTLAQVLRDQGFATAAFTGGGLVSKDYGFARGFDSFVESETRSGFSYSYPRILRWLSRPHHRPFFLFIHTYDVHVPYDPPPPYRSLFDSGKPQPLLPEDTGKIVSEFKRAHRKSQKLHIADLPPGARAELVALYDGEIRFADGFIGRIIGDLKWDGYWNRTIFILLADHGEEFWDHGSMGHGTTMYHELLHVPLIVHLPGGVDAGKRISYEVPLLDVGPTILGLLGIPKEVTFEGRSLLPLTQGRGKPPTPILSSGRQYRSLIVYPWKLIARRHGPGTQLFNLDSDPDELRDLSPEHPGRIRTMLEQLDAAIPEKWASGEIRWQRVVKARAQSQLQKLKALGYL